MKSRLLILSIILRATAGAACGQRAKSGADRSTALDSAYKAGILSKEEYEAKKRELAAAPPAPLPPPAAVRTGPLANPPAPQGFRLIQDPQGSGRVLAGSF